MEKLGAEKLELNKWWALTPQNWTCPSCKKPKQELVKLSQSGCLIAKLASHHDHANKLVDAHAPIVWLPDGTREPIAHAFREHLKKMAKGFLTRFPPTIICEGCNNLEPLLKKRHGIPSAVTLMPSEIGKFSNYDRITLDLNLESLISQLVDWEGFSMKHIDLAIQTFRSDLHPLLEGHLVWFNTGEHIEKKAASAIKQKFEKQTLPETSSLDVFLNLSVAISSKPNSNKSRLPTPTKAEFLKFSHPDPLRQRFIDKAHRDWQCPICSRNLFECFTSSRKNPKKFMLNLLERTIVFEFGQIEETAIICSECKDCHNELTKHYSNNKSEEFQAFFESGKINADALRQGIKSEPHQRHEFIQAAIAVLEGPTGHETDLDYEVDY